MNSSNSNKLQVRLWNYKTQQLYPVHDFAIGVEYLEMVMDEHGGVLCYFSRLNGANLQCQYRNLSSLMKMDDRTWAQLVIVVAYCSLFLFLLFLRWRFGGFKRFSPAGRPEAGLWGA